MKKQQPPVLLAEDNEEDIFLIRRAWQKCGIPNPLVVTNDGYQAIDYLGGQPPYTDRRRYPLPCLLLLDIKMRLLDGFEVLAWLQTRPGLRRIPAVMLSASHAEEDTARAWDLGAVDYFVKPIEPSELQSILRSVYEQWIATPAAEGRTAAARAQKASRRAPQLLFTKNQLVAG